MFERTVQMTELFPSIHSQSPKYVLALDAGCVDCSSTTAVTANVAIEGWFVHREISNRRAIAEKVYCEC